MGEMYLYVILRRSGWRSAEDLKEAAGRSAQVGDEEMSDDVRWIRSYVLDEGGGTVGTVCIYQATSAEASREHASRAIRPVDEITPVGEPVLVRPDPGPAEVAGPARGAAGTSTGCRWRPPSGATAGSSCRSARPSSTRPSRCPPTTSSPSASPLRLRSRSACPCFRCSRTGSRLA